MWVSECALSLFQLNASYCSLAFTICGGYFTILIWVYAAAAVVGTHRMCFFVHTTSKWTLITQSTIPLYCYSNSIWLTADENCLVVWTKEKKQTNTNNKFSWLDHISGFSASKSSFWEIHKNFADFTISMCDILIICTLNFRFHVDLSKFLLYQLTAKKIFNKWNVASKHTRASMTSDAALSLACRALSS